MFKCLKHLNKKKQSETNEEDSLFFHWFLSFLLYSPLRILKKSYSYCALSYCASMLKCVHQQNQ